MAEYLKVIIADDESRICQLLQKLVDWRSLGYEVVATTDNGSDALEMCESCHPDLLVSDIRMPLMSGLELIEAIYQKYPDIKVIIISGYSDFQYARDALKYGVIDYLLKPIKKSDLENALEKITRLKKDSANDRATSGPGIYQKNIADGNPASIMVKYPEKMDQVIEEYRSRNLFSGKIWQLIALECRNFDKNRSLPAVSAHIEKVIGDMLIATYKAKGSTVFFEAYQNRFYYLIAGEENHISDTNRQIENIIRSGLRRAELRQTAFTAAVSALHGELSAYRTMLDECESAFLQKIVKGENRFIFYENFQNSPANIFEAESHFRKRLAEAVRDLSSGGVRDSFSLIMDHLQIKKNTINGERLRELYAMTLDVFYEAMEKLGFEISGQFASDNLMTSFYDFFMPADAFLYLQDTFCYLLDYYNNQKEKSASRPIQEATNYIKQNFREPLTLEMVAERIGLTSSYLSSVFKKQVGKSFVDYVTDIRIQEAKRMLIENNDPVTEISDNVGFSDSKYFIKRFKKFTGLTPSSYRKMFR